MGVEIKEPPQALKGGFVGIDFGTTNSLIGEFRDGDVHIFLHPRENNGQILPSVVAYYDKNTIVGSKAYDIADSVFSVKSLLGKNLESFCTRYPMLKVSRKNNICIQIGEKNVNVIEIASEIFKKLKQTASNQSDQNPENAVITVPAYFDESARSAIKNAALIGGFKNIRLLSEPTAAALFYGVDQKKESGKYVVYDLGGGTFDVSVLDFYKGIFKVVTTDGNDLLGGDDFDKLILEHLCKKYSICNLDDLCFKRLISVCKKLKEDLCDFDSASKNAAIAGTNYQFDLTRKDFEDLISDHIENTIHTLIRAIKRSGADVKDIEGVLLVGGSTRIPLIKRRLKEIFGTEKVLSDLNPDTIVAKGAILYSSFISGTNPNRMLLLDVLPLSLGIETFGGATEFIIEKDSHVPASHSQIFTNFADYQTGFDINVVQGEREFAKNNRSLATFKLKGIPALPAGKARIEVKFTIDESGILHVEAKELTQGIKQEVEINPAYGLNKASVNQMIKESIENLESDIAAKNLLDARNYGDKVIRIIKNAINSAKEVLKESEHDAIQERIKIVQDAFKLQNCDKINAATEDLEFCASDFLQRRLSFLLSKAKLET